MPQARAGSPGGRNKGGGGALSPSPPSTSPPSSSQGLADFFGNISRQLAVARAGVPAPRVGKGRPPGVADSSSGGGAGDADRPPPHRGRLQGGRGGDVRRSGGAGPLSRGSHRASGRVPDPLPPTEEGATGRGKKGGAAAAPHADPVR